MSNRRSHERGRSEIVARKPDEEGKALRAGTSGVIQGLGASRTALPIVQPTARPRTSTERRVIRGSPPLPAVPAPETHITPVVIPSLQRVPSPERPVQRPRRRSPSPPAPSHISNYYDDKHSGFGRPQANSHGRDAARHAWLRPTPRPTKRGKREVIIIPPVRPYPHIRSKSESSRSRSYSPPGERGKEYYTPGPDLRTGWGDNHSHPTYVPWYPGGHDYYRYQNNPRTRPPWSKTEPPSETGRPPSPAGRGAPEIREYKLKSDHPFWTEYVREATKRDDETLLRDGRNLDALLVFSGLFSAVLTAFLIESYKALQPDPQETSAALLAGILQAVGPSGTSNVNMPEEPPISSSVVAVNCLWFASLVCTLGASFVCLLLKQLLDGYMYGLRTGNPQEQAYRRQFRQDNLARWRISRAIDALPTLLHMALALFLIGMSLFLWPIHANVAKVTIGTGALFVAIYLVTVVAPLLSAATPFQSPFLQDVVRFSFVDLLQRLPCLRRKYRIARTERAEAIPTNRADFEHHAVLSKQKELASSSILWAVTTSRNPEVVSAAIDALGQEAFSLRSAKESKLCIPLMVDKMRERVCSWEGGWNSSGHNELQTLVLMVRQKSVLSRNRDDDIPTLQWQRSFSAFPFGTWDSPEEEDPQHMLRALIYSLDAHAARLCGYPVEWRTILEELHICLRDPSASSSATLLLLDAVTLDLENLPCDIPSYHPPRVAELVDIIAFLSEHPHWENLAVRNTAILILDLLDKAPAERANRLRQMTYDALYPTKDIPYPDITNSHAALPLVLKLTMVHARATYGHNLISSILQAHCPGLKSYQAYPSSVVMDLLGILEHINGSAENPLVVNIMAALDACLNRMVYTYRIDDTVRLFWRLHEIADSATVHAAVRGPVLLLLAKQFSLNDHQLLSGPRAFTTTCIPQLHESLNALFLKTITTPEMTDPVSTFEPGRVSSISVSAAAVGLARQLHCEDTRALSQAGLSRQVTSVLPALTGLFEGKNNLFSSARTNRCWKEALLEWTDLPLSILRPLWTIEPSLLPAMVLCSEILELSMGSDEVSLWHLKGVQAQLWRAAEFQREMGLKEESKELEKRRRRRF